jgi:hypothetical protein
MASNAPWRRAFAIPLALSLFHSAPSLAQTFRGSINGTISDPSGAVVANAEISATDTGTGVVRNTVSSGAGEFSFADLPLSTYTIKVASPGFQTTDVAGVQVLAGKVHTLPVKLAAVSQTISVEISADALSLDTTTTAQTTTLTSSALQNTPLNGRDFTQLLGSSTSFAGYNNSGSVNGMRSDQLNYTIDGTDNNDLYLQVDAVNQGGISGIAGVIYPIDALDEYSLQTTGNAESGRSPGGNLNITTKSGTNQFHGSAYYFNRNEALAVASPFITPDSGDHTPLRNQNYGGSLGGPIWRDRTFFFLTYEEQKFLIGAVNTTTEPSPAYQQEALAVLANANGAYGNYAPVTASPVSQAILRTLWQPSLIANLPGTPLNFSSTAPESGYSHNAVVKLDHNFSEKSHISGRWYFGQGYAAAPGGSFLPEYFQVVPSHIQNYDVVWNYSLRPNLTNQVAAGVSTFTQGFADANHGFNPLTLAGLNTGSADSGSPDIAITGFDSIGPTPTSGRNDITGHISDILSWTLGKHQVRFGLEYRRAYIDLYYNFGGRGTFNFGSGGVLGPWANSINQVPNQDPNILNLADYMAGYAYQSSITLGTQERFLYTHTGSGFAEDSWQVSPKLNVNLGLRYDYQQPFYTNPANTSIFDPAHGGLVVTGAGSSSPNYDYNSNKLDFSPRVGFSYQLSPATVVRANYGLYFDQPAGQAFYGNLGIPNGGASGVNSNPAGSEPNESIIITASPSNVQPIWTPNQTTPIFTAAAGQPTGGNVVSIYSVTRNFKTPYAQNFGVNIEQSIGRAWLLNLGYVSTGSRHNLVLQDINQPALGAYSTAVPYTSTTCPAAFSGATPTQAGNNLQCSRPYFSQYPNLGIINQINSAASSSYNALQISLRSSSWHGLTSQFSYAWSHNLDDASGFNALPQNSFNLRGDWGNANNDLRNHFAAYLNYEIPGLAFGPQALTHGWELNSIVKFQDGEPISILSGSDNSGTGENEDRANITGPALNSDRSVVGYSHAQYLNRNSFSLPTNGTYGNLGRNQVTGPGFGDVDLSLIKNVPLYKERVRAQFRVEMFNILNRVNLAQPGTGTSSSDGATGNASSGSSFGASTSTIGVQYGSPGIGSGEPYNTQLAVKILF